MCSAGEVTGHHVEGEPSGIRSKSPRRQMDETDAIPQVADGVLDIGVAAVIGFEFEHLAEAVGDEGVTATSAPSRK